LDEKVLDEIIDRFKLKYFLIWIVPFISTFVITSSFSLLYRDYMIFGSFIIILTIIVMNLFDIARYTTILKSKIKLYLSGFILLSLSLFFSFNINFNVFWMNCVLFLFGIVYFYFLRDKLILNDLIVALSVGLFVPYFASIIVLKSVPIEFYVVCFVFAMGLVSLFNFRTIEYDKIRKIKTFPNDVDWRAGVKYTKMYFNIGFLIIFIYPFFGLVSYWSLLFMFLFGPINRIFRILYVFEKNDIAVKVFNFILFYFWIIICFGFSLVFIL
jgi:hypothetical protein